MNLLKHSRLFKQLCGNKKIFGYAVFSFTFIITSTTKKHMDDTFFYDDKCYQFNILHNS